MNEIEQLLKTTLAELRAIVNANTSIGDPITFEDATVIPLVKASFGFGTGGGGGKKAPNDGMGGGTGAGGKITPVALIIVDGDGVRVTPVEKGAGGAGGSTSTVDKIVEIIRAVVVNRGEDDQGEEKQTEPPQPEKSQNGG